MDQELKARWVAALRSGEYEQGRVYLEDYEGKFCCLGVLCKVMGLSTGSQNSDFSIVEYTQLPISRMNQRKLAILNDSTRLSFTEIADYIEENL